MATTRNFSAVVSTLPKIATAMVCALLISGGSVATASAAATPVVMVQHFSSVAGGSLTEHDNVARGAGGSLR
jgi:hypothetical protein